jgi:hypothetical protein
MKTTTAKYIGAVKLLKDVLLQNDEKDELQLKVEKFLIDNDELPQPFKPLTITKKEFIAECDYHKMTGAGRENDLSAVYFDWKQGNINNKYFVGYKYCVWGRTCLTGKKILIDQLYNFLTGKTENTEYYIQLVVAENDLQRFKLPITGNALQHLIKKVS